MFACVHVRVHLCVSTMLPLNLLDSRLTNITMLTCNHRQDLSIVYTDLIIMYSNLERDREYICTKRMTIDWFIG